MKILNKEEIITKISTEYFKTWKHFMEKEITTRPITKEIIEKYFFDMEEKSEDTTRFITDVIFILLDIYSSENIAGYTTQEWKIGFEINNTLEAMFIKQYLKGDIK